MVRTTACLLLSFLAGCADGSGDDLTPDACEGALVDERVNVPLECDNLGFLVKEAGRIGGIEIILAPGTYELPGDLSLKNDTTLRGEDAGDPPVIVVGGEISSLNSLIEDVVIDGVLDAKKSTLRRISATRATLDEVSGNKIDTRTLRASGEVHLVDVTASRKLEVEVWGELTRVDATEGSVVLVSDSAVSDSTLPEVIVHPDGEARDRIDVVLSDVVLHGGVTARSGTTGTLYLTVQDSDLEGLVVDSSTKSATAEVELLRTVVSGSRPVILDLAGADNYGLQVNNSLVFGAKRLLATSSSGDDLAEDAQITVHNSVFMGGELLFEQTPQCGVISTTSLDLRNNVFVDVDFSIHLAVDQILGASHNLFMDADCDSCVSAPTDTCAASGVDQPLTLIGADGSLSGDAGFVGLDADDPAGSDLHLTVDSPAVDAGVPEWSDPDGSRSDIGLYGGGDAAP